MAENGPLLEEKPQIPANIPIKERLPWKWIERCSIEMTSLSSG